MFSALRAIFKKELSFPFAGIGVDMHAHVLPGLDDGADTMDRPWLW